MQLQKKKRSWGGDLKERSGLLKAPVFLFFFSFLLFSFVFILDYISLYFRSNLDLNVNCKGFS